MQICPCSFVLPHIDLHIKTDTTRTFTHACASRTPNKGTHANAPLLCSAGGILTGFRCEPINSAMIHSLGKALLASFSRHSNIIIRSKYVLVHFSRGWLWGFGTHSGVVLSLRKRQWYALLPHYDLLNLLHKEKHSYE
ncbi:hypothetical protein CRENBAI_026535 [Crenichthys baileyi]|uniref:Uncharacterized protein n=1 Tax=Crenichthys baileyi TaxID=28760 RepID=A0AAV9R770_9TELE